MPVFENHDITSFGKNFFKDLNPGKAPQYFLVIAADIALVHICSGMLTSYWLQLFAGLLVFIAFILYSAIRNRHELEARHIVGQLKTARIVSVGIAILALATASIDTQYYPPAFYAVLVVTGLQVFLALRFNSKYRWVSDKKIRVVNLPQLTLISSSLLIGFTISTSEFATRSEIAASEALLYGKRFENYPSDKPYMEPEEKSKLPLLARHETMAREINRLRRERDSVKYVREGLVPDFSGLEPWAADSAQAQYDSISLLYAKEDSIKDAAIAKLENEYYYTEKDVEQLRRSRKAISKAMTLLNGLELSVESSPDMNIPNYIWGRVRQERLHYGLTAVVLFAAWLSVFITMVVISRKINRDVAVQEPSAPGTETN